MWLKINDYVSLVGIPSGAPINISASAGDKPTSQMLRWDPPVAELRNGHITQYTVSSQFIRDPGSNRSNRGLDETRGSFRPNINNGSRRIVRDDESDELESNDDSDDESDDF